MKCWPNKYTNKWEKIHVPPFSVLLWDLAQSQGCFWRSSPWFCSLKGSFISHRGSFFSPPPSSLHFQLSVWGSQTGRWKPSFFPWSISLSLPPCFSFPLGTAFIAVSTDDLCYHQHPSKWIYSPPTLPRCSATPSCPSSQTGLSEFLSPSADAMRAARSGQTQYFKVWAQRRRRSALSERPWSPIKETTECHWWTNVSVYWQQHLVNQNRKAVQPFWHRDMAHPNVCAHRWITDRLPWSGIKCVIMRRCFSEQQAINPDIVSIGVAFCKATTGSLSVSV